MGHLESGGLVPPLDPRWLRSWLRIYRHTGLLDFSGNFEMLFLKAMKENFGSQIQALWHVGILFICWLIWKSRNEEIFEEKN